MIYHGDEFLPKFVSIVGCLYLLRLILYLSYESWCGFRTYVWSGLVPRVNLKEKYGPWAVVTGSTDGLGKEFALQLAKQGMNIVLISRSEAKLESTAAVIKSLHQVEVKCIQADFSKTDVYDQIKKELDVLDIGILVNNVGILNETPELIMDQSEDFLERIVNINIMATILNTSIVIKKMKEKNRGLIINMGSQSGVMPVPYLGVYSSTKAFVDHYSSILVSELTETNIDVKCFRGGFIKTNLLSHVRVMVDFYDKYLPLSIPDAQTYVKSALYTSNTSVVFTCGYWPHSVILFLGENFMSKKMQLAFSKFIMSSKFIWKESK